MKSRLVHGFFYAEVNLATVEIGWRHKLKLCKMKGTMTHILSRCQITLTQGRYRWRHDRFLQVLVNVLEVESKLKRPTKLTWRQIEFVKHSEATADTYMYSDIRNHSWIEMETGGRQEVDFFLTMNKQHSNQMHS